MASKDAFDAMNAKDWQKVKEIVTANLTTEELEKKHGVSKLNIDLSYIYIRIRINI